MLVHVEMIDIPDSKFDKAIEWLTIALLAFMPLAFGAVQAWSEEIVVAFAAAITICYLVKLIFEQDVRPVWSWTYVPIALFILVAVLQIIPLPADLVAAISPNTAATKKELLGDLPNAAALLRYMTLSFYPNATRHDLRLVLAVAAVFFVTVNVYRRPEQIKRLLTAVAIIGGTIAALALAQNALGNGKIYWMVPTGHNQAYAGTFVNHSHYSQFMNLSIGAALALVMAKFHEAFVSRKVTPVALAEFLGSPRSRFIWVLIGIIILAMATVVVSLSRGGMFSMLIAGAVTTVVLSASKSLRGRSWVMVLLTLGAFIAVLFIGFDAVCDRLAALSHFNQAEGGRWQIVKDVATAWTRFPLFGTGLGTHEVVYPMFDRSTIPMLASHAENEYAQVAEETGILGLIPLSALFIGVWVNHFRIATVQCIPISSAAYGLAFGLVAIMVHSLSDFGQHIPANAFLSAISVGLLISLSRMNENADLPVGSAGDLRRVRGLRIGCLALVSMGFAWSLIGADRARAAESQWARALRIEETLRAKGWRGSDEEYIALIRPAARAAKYEPANIHYRHWLNVYRWRSISHTTDPNTGAVTISVQAMESVRRIVRELHNARVLCPTYGATCSVVGQLELFVLNDADGAERIRRGFLLAPSDPTACFVAGLLDARNDKTEESYEKLSRAVKLDGRLFEDAVHLCIDGMQRPDLAVALAGDSTHRLSRVADILIELGQHKELARQARSSAIALLKERCSQPDAPAAALASMANIYAKTGDTEAAIEHYRRALALDYSQIRWRLDLARLLAATNRVPEAIHEARIGLRLRPRYKAAEKLIADLSILPGALADEGP